MSLVEFAFVVLLPYARRGNETRRWTHTEHTPKNVKKIALFVLRSFSYNVVLSSIQTKMCCLFVATAPLWLNICAFERA